MIAWQDRLGGPTGLVVDRYVTDNVGGVSTGDFAGLNLGDHVGDDPASVERNRVLLAEAVGVPRDHLVLMQQVHGSDVDVVDGPRTSPAPPADGVITSRAGLALVVLVADCTPVLLADVETGWVAAVHAGRPGMVAGAVPATVRRMRELGARQIQAVVGPSVCGRCYEVPSQMRADAAAVSPASFAVTWQATPAIDVASGVVAQLADLEVPVTWVPGCTRERDDLYSYRRRSRTGRFAGVVVLRQALA